jgi:hypothetical protein
MTRHLVAPTLLLTVALSGGTASADPIRVTAGTLEMTGPTGVVSLTGTRGFTLSPRVSLFDGVFAPWDSCGSSRRVCRARASALRVSSLAWACRATATLDGQTFSHVGSLESDDHAVLRLAGSAIAPVFTARRGDPARAIHVRRDVLDPRRVESSDRARKGRAAAPESIRGK